MTPSQPSLFTESLEEALRDCVSVLKGPKAVGVMLWPSMKADLAGRRLNQCLDPERDEKLDPSEIMTIAKQARAHGCHSLMAFMAQELDYEWKAIDPETVEAREKRELAELLRVVNERLARLEKRESNTVLVRRVA